MERKDNQLILGGILLFYLFLGILLWPRYRYVINADGLSYISIAKKYLAGRWSEAVNGYWSPLYSWLLLPFLLFIKNSLQAARLLNLFLSSLLLYGFYLNASLFHLSLFLRFFLLVFLFPLAYYFAFSMITPDLLVATLLLFYFYFLLNPAYPHSSRRGSLAGVLGSLTYLAKSYNFFFFLFHFPLMNFLISKLNKGRSSKQKLKRHFVTGMIAFLLLSGLWITAISLKYKKFTISTTMARAWTLVAPTARGEALRWIGLYPPPNSTALSAWEDPSSLPLDIWNPFSSHFYFIHFLGNIFKNLANLFEIMASQSIFYLLILMAFLAVTFYSFFKKHPSSPLLLFSLVSFFLYPAGFLLLYVVERYIWIEFLWLILFTGYLFSQLMKRFIRAKIIIFFLFLFILASYSLEPLHYLISDYKRVTEYGTSGRKIYQISEILKTKFDLKGNVASNDRWNESLFLCYYLGCRYFGQIKEDISVGELKAELEKYKIKYFFLWGTGQDEEKLRPLTIRLVEFPGVRLKVLKTKR